MNDTLPYRINALVNLGNTLRTDPNMDDVIAKAAGYNPWFTVGFCHTAIDAITERMLTEDKLKEWLARYEISDDRGTAKTIGIIMAGNLPLVGFHDFLCAYISGYNIKVKLSGKDDVLFPYVYEKLMGIDPLLKPKSSIIERLDGFDAVIATGSNNTNRYFEYYFRDYPKILRRSRNSIAILTGHESEKELLGLADDIFMYFGFGCRNVSKLYVPDDYDITGLFPHFEKYKWMHGHTKYMNNYDYNRTLLLLNRTPHLANEIVMLQENTAIASPVSVLYYEKYKDAKTLAPIIDQNSNNIQCIVSSSADMVLLEKHSFVKFGKTQFPELWDYADDIDTLDFLISLKSLN